MNRNQQLAEAVVAHLKATLDQSVEVRTMPNDPTPTPPPPSPLSFNDTLVLRTHFGPMLFTVKSIVTAPNNAKGEPRSVTATIKLESIGKPL